MEQKQKPKKPPQVFKPRSKRHKKQKPLPLQLKDCCGVLPKMAFNKRGTLGIYCQQCKKFLTAADNEWVLELVQRWNQAQ